MDMSNVINAIASNVDTDPINKAIEQRANTLGEQLNPEAKEQFIKDMSSLLCSVSAKGSSVSFSVSPSESYLIEYLKSHGTPVTGGDGGIVHDPDGSTRPSNVPPQLWGTELPWYEMPTVDGEDEAYHIVEMLARDAVTNALEASKKDIAESVKPYIQEELSKMIGGGLS